MDVNLSTVTSNIDVFIKEESIDGEFLVDTQRHGSKVGEDEKCRPSLIEIGNAHDYVEEIVVDYGYGYRCDMCEQIFVSDSQLIDHMSSYLKCKVCSRNFCNLLVFKLHKTTHMNDEQNKIEVIKVGNDHSDEEELNGHSLREEVREKTVPESVFECAHCSRWFTRRTTLVSPLKLHSGEKPSSCDECGKNFRQQCCVHEMSDCSFQCDTCQQAFKSKNRLVRHIKDEHALNKQFICPFCDKLLKSCYTLQNHIKLHTKEGLFSCYLCNKQYSAAGNLRSHLRLHVDEKPFTCKFCDSTFKEKGNWKRHVKKHFEEKIQCEYCQNLFSVDYYYIHLRLHTGEKPYECTYCGKRFMQCSGLKSHLITHTNEKPYSCSYCDKSFAFRSHRQRHMITHTDGDFPCSVCERTFNSEHRLSDHFKIHTGEIVYECKQCERRFTQKSNLVAHERIHSGREKPFKCSLCDLRFYTNSSLKSHSVSHRGEKMFACVVCDKTFKHKTSLNSHVLAHIVANKCNICNKTFSCKTNLVQHVQKHYTL